MTATIAYDRDVANLIDELSATGHVFHTAHRKTSVTLHHNAGRFSHQGLLEVWRKRPASAHFDVDAAGEVAQYVKVNEFAWAVGNVAGNQRSISIEMANATLAPGWTVGEATWRSAARLAGWNFAKVIGERPSKSNLFYHHRWSSTVCAGPHMDDIYDQVLEAAQAAYDQFKNSHPDPRPDTEPFPGASFFQAGRTSPIVAAMHERLVAEDCNRYESSAGADTWGPGDVRSFAAWQRKLGFAGGDADGTPGRTSWDKLRVPNV
ncbi:MULTISPECIES: peptidoglycan-binding protein [Streptomyces]|uniref:Peptidoglycan-binding protein n=1 Tax=Streptomyces caniscabiei TaxID=2746961 RepID=A0ABU4N507_9ACTN|nr:MULTISPECIES: peptidoglycan-binding protein [Streptomyces]MBE4741138.1 N-acetylmuramoyl-L-alanine amidase [Streptomyces caniscabiei]MBE4760789.1 N-acetylmuramoyl-L-alanine amidase [Streptomyces caniscabiei]MBE4774773.1 N-acetylmuramoyl-L-alanine amidase [Streptomyces caniscabiei]MBE4789531.1 N-acetylmuramoyl-L-alanine amidase [Streptomyces caniscabiei]MBE4798800.1 N-acetylmuramoyl-L-alanine amidase [Streptomyces caniscabiei]